MTDQVTIKKYRKLVDSLYLKTDSGEISWEESIIFDGFDVRLGQNMVNFNVVPTGQTVPDYEIKVVRGSDFLVIDSFRDTNLHDDGIQPAGGFSTYFRLMEAMYSMIQRKISGSDEVLDDLLNNLG
jgi:hypothetical protein